MNPDPPEIADAAEACLRLLAQHERWLTAYVYSLVACAADADDILQEVKVTIWKQFASFQAGTNFRAWARTIATHQVLNFRRAEKRRPVSTLDQQFIEAVATEIDRRSDLLDRQADALRTCLAKLPEAHRNIILWRYHEEQGIDEIACKTQRSAEAVYRLLSRIRFTLHDCVRLQLRRAMAS